MFEKVKLADFTPGLLVILIASISVISYYTYKFSHFQWLRHESTYRTRVVTLDEYHGDVFLNDSIKIGAAFDNSKPYPPTLDEYLAVGDSIVKAPYNDALRVIKRNREVKWFVLNHKCFQGLRHGTS